MKEVFDEHAHSAGLDPSMLRLVIEDRAAAGGERTLSGAEVAGVSRGFLEMRDGSRIPLHRVVEVRSRGALVLPRRKGRGP